MASRDRESSTSSSAQGGSGHIPSGGTAFEAAIHASAPHGGAAHSEDGQSAETQSDLRAMLARVEASRDELARQQGQHKGLIAKVPEGGGQNGSPGFGLGLEQNA